ncbi:MAG: DUF4214 domain-containing protein, partial [Clostridiales bacterium]|nr:DUF4214 domain-containing protein [Clostridiales bacterium]
TGLQITPDFIVTLGETVLIRNVDYTVEYGNNINAGTGAGILTITGAGNYTGETSITFDIAQADISGALIAPVSSQIYTGSAIEPEVTVTLDETILESGTDYTVSYVNNTAIGTATVTVTGCGNYTGSPASVNFEIVPKDISEAVISAVPDQTYTGSAIEPSFTVTLNGTPLVYGTDYSVGYSNNIDAGTASVTVTGYGIYTGSASATFAITQLSLEDAGITIDQSADLTYTGSQIAPLFTVILGETELHTGDDFSVEYGDNINAGTGAGSITITGTGNYSGEASVTFDIAPASITGSTVTIVNTPVYTGGSVAPSFTVTLPDERVLGENDYTFEVSSTTGFAAGTDTASLVVRGAGNYTGELDPVTFTIVPAEINSATVAAIADQTYTGSAIEPEITVTLNDTTLVRGTDYTVSYANNTAIGTATATVTGCGNYTGSPGSVTFEIVQASISGAIISAIPDQTYTGSAIEPDVTVTLGDDTLVRGTDYTVSYADNTAIGRATVTVTGCGNYSGTLEPVTFNIVPIDISQAVISEIPDQTYTGSAIEPAVTVTFGDVILERDTEYTVSYADNTDVGTATVTVTGCGIYSGSPASVTFTIIPADINSATVAAIADQTYNGLPLFPEVTLTFGGAALTSGTDYNVSFSENTEVGTAHITVTGTGNFTGENTGVTFSIIGIDIANATIGSIAPLTYTGSALTPELTVRYNGTVLAENTDYRIAYGSNTNAGTATVTLTGIGHFRGTNTGATFTIAPASISEAVIADISSQTYCASAITPPVSVSLNGAALTAGTDYTVAYSDNTNAGTASVTITGCGNYTGSPEAATFTIAPLDISGASVAAIADHTYAGSQIRPFVTIRINGRTLISGTDYETAYTDNIEVGTANVAISGVGNYTGSITTTFNIVAAVPTEPDNPTVTPGTDPTVSPAPTDPPTTETPTAAPTETPSGSARGVESFVERLYTVALGRASDPAGQQAWVDAIRERGETGADVARGFLYSDEFLNKDCSNEEFVQTLYQTFFGRAADEDGLAAWVGVLEGGVTRQNVIEGFINSTEWANLCLTYGISSGGAGVPDIEIEPNDDVIAFCTRLYTTCLGRNADQRGLMAWARQLANRRDTGAGAARGFFFSSEFLHQNVDNGEFVRRLYLTFMGREPDEAGYNAWVGQLDSGVSRNEVFEGFVGSQEFTDICSKYGIIRGD